MKLVILVGLPGSGKSTYAKKHYPTYFYINQDTLGSRTAVTNAVNSAMKQGLNIVLDRCNINRQQRSPWLNKAMMYGYESSCVVLWVKKETCIARIKARASHQTLPKNTNPTKIDLIVRDFAASYQEPMMHEGLKVITFVENE